MFDRWIECAFKSIGSVEIRLVQMWNNKHKSKCKCATFVNKRYDITIYLFWLVFNECIKISTYLNCAHARAHLFSYYSCDTFSKNIVILLYFGTFDFHITFSYCSKPWLNYFWLNNQVSPQVYLPHFCYCFCSIFNSKCIKEDKKMKDKHTQTHKILATYRGFH